MKFIQFKKYWLVYLYPLLAFQFFGYVGLPLAVEKLACFAIQLVMFVLCWRQINSSLGGGIYKLIKLIMISLFLSIVSAWAFNGQGLMLSYRVSAGMLSLPLYFFYLYKRRPPVSVVENVVWFYGLLYCILWMYAMSQIPNVVFGVEDEINEDISRGMIRINFVGRGMLVLCTLLAINKYYSTAKKVFLIIAAVFCVFLIMQLTRQLILWTALVTAGYIYVKNRRFAVSIVTLLCVSLFMGQTIKFDEDSVIGAMIDLSERQAEQQSSGDEDVRITEYKYFMGDYSKNIVTDVIGSGMPHTESSYGRFYTRLQEVNKLFLSDVGYAMMFAVTGLFGLCLYLLLFFKSSFSIVPPELAYTRMFMIFMIPANIAASWYAQADFMICMAICCYLIVVHGNNNKKCFTQ